MVTGEAPIQSQKTKLKIFNRRRTVKPFYCLPNHGALQYLEGDEACIGPSG